MIKVNNLAFSYGSTPVLENISLNFEPGKIYGLLGENGVGKTTLLTLLCGLKKAGSGSIDTDGSCPADRKPSTLNNQYFLPDEVAASNESAISFARHAGVFWPRFDKEKFLEILNVFEVDPAKNMCKMSAGQLKKTYISFALSLGVKYLFLDEPTNGLDIPSKAQFRKAVTRYTEEDSTIIISTHQVRDLENVIDPIIILDRRDVLVNASLEEITGKLYFDYGTTLDPDALYCEQMPGGFIQVKVNSTGEESKVNIEALFNAVHAHKELVRNLLKK